MAKTKPRKATASEVLRQAIQDSGMSQNELARLTGVEQASISRFTRGERDLSLGSVDRLLPILGLELRRVAKSK